MSAVGAEVDVCCGCRCEDAVVSQCCLPRQLLTSLANLAVFDMAGASRNLAIYKGSVEASAEEIDASSPAHCSKAMRMMKKSVFASSSGSAILETVRCQLIVARRCEVRSLPRCLWT